MEAQELAIKAEIDRLTNRRLSIANNIRCMKLSLQKAMETTGKTKFKTTLFTFGIQKNPASVIIDVDEGVLPDEYLIPQPPKVDKKKIRDDLKNGIDIGVAHLEQTESLRIK